jgi:hypothetical protein
MDVPTFARRAGMRPVRRVCTYLAHLAELNLLVRGYDADRRLHYRITPRGLARLVWLVRKPEPPTVLELIASVFPTKDQEN